jgi:heterotetrameric sarcosine oxidase gamma subunit
MRAFAPRRLTAMYRAHVALGARLVEDHGWMVAEAFTSPRDEEVRARAGVGLADVSAGARLGVRGHAVDALLAKTAGVSAPPARTARRVRIGGAEALVCRRAPDELLVLAGPAEAETVGRELSDAAGAGGCAHVTDLSSGLAAVEAIGPAAQRLLARVSPLDLARLGPLEIAHGQVARVAATVIRLDHPELPTYRVLVGREVGAFVWNALADAGQSLGLVRIGAFAHRLLRHPEGSAAR